MVDYRVINNDVEFLSPATGLFTGVVLQSQSVAFFGTRWGNRVSPSVALPLSMKLPQSHYDYTMKNGSTQANNMRRRWVVFKDGKKMVTNSLSTDPTYRDALVNIANGELTIQFFSSAGAFNANTYIEVLLLDEVVYNTSQYLKVVLPPGTTGTEYTFNFNQSGYVTKNDFHRNVLVFKNGLLMSPARTYFWIENNRLNFDSVNAGDVLEFYFLTKDPTKPHRIYGMPYPLVNEDLIALPEYPNTSIEVLP